MLRRTRHLVMLSTLIALGAIAAFAFVWRHDLIRSFERAALPEAVEYQPIASDHPLPVIGSVSPRPTTPPPASSPTKTVVPSSLPAEINLAVPFTPQAPHANWELPYKEFCEEASVLMAASYLQGEDIPSPEVADQKMLAIKAFEEQRFGHYEDTTAAETATILRDYYKIAAVELRENPSATDIKRAVAARKLVIVPAAGQLLHNPYFRAPGPPYHMLVVKGYTADGQFIVHDPGTRRGADYVYEESVIMNAIHDWRTDGKVEQGAKVILIVG